MGDGMELGGSRREMEGEGGGGVGERFRFTNKLNVQLNNKWKEFSSGERRRKRQG